MSLPELEENCEVLIDFVAAIGSLFPHHALAAEEAVSDQWIAKALELFFEWCNSNGFSSALLPAVDRQAWLFTQRGSVGTIVETGILPYGINFVCDINIEGAPAAERFVDDVPHSFPLICLAAQSGYLEEFLTDICFESIEEAVAAMSPAALLAYALRNTYGYCITDYPVGLTINGVVANPLRHLAALYVCCNIQYLFEDVSYYSDCGCSYCGNPFVGVWEYAVEAYLYERSRLPDFDCIDVTWARMGVLHQMVEDAKVIRNTCPPLALCSDESWLFEQTALARAGF